MDELEKKVNAVQDDVSRILFYLESDDKTDTKGLVQKVNEMQTELNELLTREKIYRAKAGVFGVLGGIAVWVVKIMFQKIL